MSPLRYELGFYIPEDDILHGYCRENFKSSILSMVFILTAVLGPCLVEIIHD
jgi:hypothetical protein